MPIYKEWRSKLCPSSGREEDLNPGPPDYKPCPLTTRPRQELLATPLPQKIVLTSTHSLIHSLGLAKHKKAFVFYNYLEVVQVGEKYTGN